MTAKQSIAWLQAAWKDDKKRINLLLVSGLAGMLLLCMSEWLPAGQSTQNAAQSSQQSQTAAEYEQQLETRLAALIRAMDGAGETVVMVTLDCGEETTYAADTRTEKTSEDTRSSAASQRTHLLAGAQPVGAPPPGGGPPSRWCSRFRHRRCAAWPCFARAGVMPEPSAASQNWSAP